MQPALIVRWIFALVSGALAVKLSLELLGLSAAPDPLALPPDYRESSVGTAPSLWLMLTLSIAVVDFVLAKQQTRFVNGLDGLVKDIGQYISAGHGVESAVHEATKSRRGRASRILSRILRPTNANTFEDGLRQAAYASTNPGFREAALLLEQSVRAGGAAGKRVQETGEVLAQVRAMEERFRASTTFGLGLIRALGLLIVPAMFSLLAVQTEFSIAPYATSYFAAMAFGVAVLEWRVARDITRGLFRWPLYVTLITFLLCSVGQLLVDSAPTGFSL